MVPRNSDNTHPGTNFRADFFFRTGMYVGVAQTTTEILVRERSRRYLLLVDASVGTRTLSVVDKLGLEIRPRGCAILSHVWYGSVILSRVWYGTIVWCIITRVIGWCYLITRVIRQCAILSPVWYGSVLSYHPCCTVVLSYHTCDRVCVILPPVWYGSVILPPVWYGSAMLSTVWWGSVILSHVW